MIQLPANERGAIAQAAGINEQYLYQCLTRRRKMPAERCPAIEREAAGRVTVDQLRPDLRWTRIPDPAWPHPNGRPCLDIAAPAAEEEARDAA